MVPGFEDWMSGDAAATDENRQEHHSQATPAARGSQGMACYPRSLGAYDVMARLGSGPRSPQLACCPSMAGSRVVVHTYDLPPPGDEQEMMYMRLDALADMRHSNVLQLLAYFAEDYDLYIVVPFQDAGSLRSILHFCHPEGFTAAAPIATLLLEVAKGLAYIHDLGLAHGDVTAENVLLSPYGQVCLSAPSVLQGLSSWRQSTHSMHTGSRSPQSGGGQQVSPMGGGGVSAFGRVRERLAQRRAQNQAEMEAAGSSRRTLLAQALDGRQPRTGWSGQVDGGSAHNSVSPPASGSGRSFQISYSQDARAGDILGVGLMVLELVTGRPADRRQQLESHSTWAQAQQDAPEEFKVLISACLLPDSGSRPTARELPRYLGAAGDPWQLVARSFLVGVPMVHQRTGAQPWRHQDGPAVSEPSEVSNGTKGSSGSGSMDTSIDIAGAVELAAVMLRASNDERLPARFQRQAFRVSSLLNSRGLAFLQLRQKNKVWHGRACGFGFVVSGDRDTGSGAMRWSLPSLFTAKANVRNLKRGEECAFICAVQGEDLNAFASDKGVSRLHFQADNFSPAGCRSPSTHGFMDVTVSDCTVRALAAGNQPLYGLPVEPYTALTSPADENAGHGPEHLGCPPDFKLLYAELRMALGRGASSAAAMPLGGLLDFDDLRSPSLR